MARIDLVVWNPRGSHRLLQDGRVPSVEIPHGTEASPGEIVDAARRALGFDVVLLRIGGDGSVEVEHTGRDPAGARGLIWQPWTMTPPAAERPAWHRPGWVQAAVTAADAVLAARGLTRTGPPVQARHTSVTGMLRLETDRYPVWLKEVLPIFRHEGAVAGWVAGIAPGHAPDVLATRSSWWLAKEFPEPAPDPTGDFLDVLSEVQIASISRLPELRALGCPDRSAHLLPDAVESITRTTAGLRRELASALRSVLPELARACKEVAALGIPDTLVHGDLHVGNVAHDGDALVLYDWSDAAVSHPFLDLIRLSERLPQDEQDRARAAFADVWRAAFPDADVDRALELAVSANTIYQVVTFEQIYRAGEDVSYWEMRGIVARFLRELPGHLPRPVVEEAR